MPLGYSSPIISLFRKHRFCFNSISMLRSNCACKFALLQVELSPRRYSISFNLLARISKTIWYFIFLEIELFSQDCDIFFCKWYGLLVHILNIIKMYVQIQISRNRLPVIQSIIHSVSLSSSWFTLFHFDLIRIRIPNINNLFYLLIMAEAWKQT